MKESVYKSYDELPLFLNAETVAKLPGVSPSSGYKLFQAETQQRNLVKERFRELIAHYDECPFDASPRLTELFFRKR